VVDVPQIEFPCDYPIKVIGVAEAALRSSVTAIVTRHCPDFDQSKMEVIESRNGKYVSLRFLITAKGKEHIQQLFLDLETIQNVQMVL
jgi:uncharacterized protein